jgi:hypothetical protein
MKRFYVSGVKKVSPMPAEDKAPYFAGAARRDSEGRPSPRPNPGVD